MDMNLEELEEALDELFPGGFSIETDSHGEMVIYTGLALEEDGELGVFESEEEEDEDLDPDFDPLEDEDMDDE
jgi:hypothetical protein